MGNNNQTILYKCGSKYVGVVSTNGKPQDKGTLFISSSSPSFNNKLAVDKQNIATVFTQFDQNGIAKTCSLETKSGFKYQGKVKQNNKQNLSFQAEGKLINTSQGVTYQGVFEKGKLIQGKITCLNNISSSQTVIQQKSITLAQAEQDHHISYICQTRNKGSYIGTSILNGQGIYYNMSENYLVSGQFHKGNLVNGEYFYPNGDYYIGDFMQGSPHGQGEYITAGFGMSTLKLFQQDNGADSKVKNSSTKIDNKDQFVKIYKENLLKSVQKINLSKQKNKIGYFYRGQFHTKQFCGKGQLHFSNGAKYKGKFKQGQFNGHGQYYFTDGTIYKGLFYFGSMNGDCIMQFTQNSSINKDKQPHEILQKYQGQVSQGLFSGIGILYYANGVIYKGYFHQGARNGPGVLIYCQNKFKCLYVMNKLVGQLKDLSITE